MITRPGKGNLLKVSLKRMSDALSIEQGKGETINITQQFIYDAFISVFEKALDELRMEKDAKVD